MTPEIIDSERLLDWLIDEIDILYADGLLREAHEASYIFNHIKENFMREDEN